MVSEKLKLEGYELVSGDYKNNKSILLIRCPNGHEYKISWANFNNGDRCSKCKGTEKYHNRYTYEDIKKYIESFNYELLLDKEDYTNILGDIWLKCPFNHVYKTNFNNFKNNGYRCSYCAGNMKYSYEEIKKYIESFEYKILSKEYINSNSHIEIECPRGHKYLTTFSKFKNSKRRCPICCISKGEERIINWLNKNNIDYIYEKKFQELLGIGGGILSYDFYLPKYNLLIEYQGIQHEQYIKGLQKNVNNFEIQQKHDERKREYARNHKINLLEIWYWDFDNIEDILKEAIK